MRAEIALAEAAHAGAATVKETLVNRQRGNVAWIFVQGPNQSSPGTDFQQSPPEGNKVTGARSGAEELDVAADRVERDVKCLIKDEAATWHHGAIAQIKGMKKTDGADEIARRSEQIGLDTSTGDLIVAAGSENPHLVLFRNPAQDFDSSANLEL